MYLSNSLNNRTEINWLEPDLETFDKYDKLVVLCHGWWTINAWIAEAGNVLISNGICLVVISSFFELYPPKQYKLIEQKS